MDASRIVLYGIGSPLVLDAEEACDRAGVTIVAGVRNVPADVHTSAAVRVVDVDALDAQLLGCAFLVALFTPGHRKAAVAEARNRGFTRGATIVDPSTPVARSATLAEGVFVNAGCVIAAGAVLAEWTLVNRSASIGHHARVDAYASIGPGAVLCGNVTIERGATIGAGAVILPGVQVGANAVVGAGSLVRQSVPSHARCEGHPARVVQTGIAGYKDLSV
jgi:sugar O-acyltransferase (sialic acid O-acetyltransferase NeuD family)